MRAPAHRAATSSVSGSSSDSAERTRALLRAASVAGALVVLTGSLVLVGWATGTDSLRSGLAPGDLVVLPTAALLFVLEGAGLVLLAQSRAHAWTRGPARALALVGFLLGFIMFVQRLAGWDLGINRVLFGGTLESYPFRPIGLMAVNSGACFALLGIALFETEIGTRRTQRMADMLGATTLLIVTMAL